MKAPIVVLNVQCSNGHDRVLIKPPLVMAANGARVYGVPTWGNEALQGGRVVATGREARAAARAGARSRTVLECTRCGGRVEMLPETVKELFEAWLASGVDFETRALRGKTDTGVDSVLMARTRTEELRVIARWLSARGFMR